MSNIFWDISRSLSYNALFNYIIGNRGCGKTYGVKKYVINNFIKKEEQFVYVRRYKEELKKKNKFFDDIKDEFSDHNFSVDKEGFKIDNKVAGNAIALSTSKIEKSTPFPKVSTIIFDEFILDKGYHRYLPDEVTNFLELYSTIARLRDVKVYFLSNALSITNPYFLYFDIKLPYGNTITCKNDILIELVQNEEFIEKSLNTRFGKIIAGTPYGDYAIENKFLRDNKNFVTKKTKNSRYVFTLFYKANSYGVWKDLQEGLYFISEDIDKNCKIKYSVTLQDHSPNMLLLKGRKNGLFDNFINAFKLGCVRFETINIKNIMYEVLQMTL